MALFHFNVTQVKRSEGQSAIASALESQVVCRHRRPKQRADSGAYAPESTRITTQECETLINGMEFRNNLTDIEM